MSPLRPHHVGGFHRHGAMVGLRHAHGPVLLVGLATVAVGVLVVPSRR